MGALEQKIIQLICDQTGYSQKRVILDKCLFHDLGTDGADERDTLVEIAEKYIFDMSEIDIEKYFVPELGATPLSFLRVVIDPAFRRGDQFIPIRIWDLVKWAEHKRWPL